MDLIGWLLTAVVGVFVGGSVAYLVWRVLDRRDVDALRAQVEVLERRIAAIEAGRS